MSCFTNLALTTNSAGTGPVVYINGDPVLVYTQGASANTAFTGGNASVHVANNLKVSTIQDITINAASSLFEWTQADSSAVLVTTTPTRNSVAMNVALTQELFNTGKGSTGSLFDLASEQTPIFWRAYLQGDGTGLTVAGTYEYVEGCAYVSGFAAANSPTAPVWVTPLTLEVVGEYTKSSVTVT